MKGRFLFMLSALVLPAPFAAADNIADCEVLIAERIEDEATGGSALISSYRPAGAFISSVYDDEAGYIREIDGHKIRALLCQRRLAIPTLRDYPLLETGIPLSLSQNFDSALSDLVITRFKDGAFRAEYTGPGLSAEQQAELEDVIEVFNLQPNDLAAREPQQKTEASPDLEPTPDLAAPIEIVTLEADDNSEPEIISDANIQPDIQQAAAEDMPVKTAVAGDVVTAQNPLPPESPEPESPELESLKPKNLEPAGPPSQDAASFPADNQCRIVARDALGQLQEIPISTAKLYDTLENAPIFVSPVPPGLNLRAIKCLRDSLTPGANDYKVARAGYPFFYQVDSGDKRTAALEFTGGKFRMNLLEGEFTAQELIDAKARILSFNDQHLKDIQYSLSGLKKGEK